MEIKVLGSGCSTCKTLFSTVEDVVKELGIDAKVIKEEDLMNIMSYNVLSLPALVIDEKVVAKGSRSLKEIKEIIRQNIKEL